MATTPPYPWRPDFRPRLQSWLSRLFAGPVALYTRLYRATRGRGCVLIGVTGSFGKTTTSRAIAAVLGQPTNQEAVANAFSRLYFQALRLMRSRTHGVVEMGVGRPGQMRAYARVVRPQIAVVTCIDFEHEKHLPDGLDGIRNEKAELVRALRADGTAVLNRDDDRVMWMASQTRARVVTFGRHAEADVALVASSPTARGMHLQVRIGGRDYNVRTQLVGAVMVTPILAALAAAHAAGLSIDDAIVSLQQLGPSQRRLEPVALPNGVSVLLDDCKGTPATAHAAIDAVAGLPPGRRIAVLGIIPLGTPEPKSRVYEELGRHAGGVFDHVLLIHHDDDAFEAYRRGLLEGGLPEDRIQRIGDVHEATDVLRKRLEPGDTLLLKGHFADHLTRIAMMLRDEPCKCRLTQCWIRDSRWCSACPSVLRASA